MSMPLPAPTATATESDATRARVLDAALACIARYGTAKTTLDDVARAAGCSRATLYRNFPGKQHVLAAVVRREAGRLRADVAAAAAGCDTAADALVAVVTAGARFVTGHPALRTVFEVEPHVLAPYLTLERADVVLDHATAAVAPALLQFLVPDRADRVAEWLTRITLSYLCSPSPSVDLADEASVRALVHDFVLPGLVPSERVRG